MANKRTSLTEREKRPVDALFAPSIENVDKQTTTYVNKQTSIDINNDNGKQVEKQSKEEYIRQTYYLGQDQIDSLSVYSTFEKLDKSEIVREALAKFIPEKYKEMAKKITSK